MRRLFCVASLSVANRTVWPGCQRTLVRATPSRGCASTPALTVSPHVAVTSNVGPAASSPVPHVNGFRAHTHILEGILKGGDSPARKRKRVRGVVRKLEVHHVEWMSEVALEGPEPTARASVALLAALSRTRPFLESHRMERAGGVDAQAVHRFVSAEDADAAWSGVSPFFSPELGDALCVCLREAAQATTTTPEDMLSLLNSAVALELGDSDAMQAIVLVLTSRNHCTQSNATDLVQTLRLLSLAVKRCKLQPPPLDHILCRLPSERNLSARDALNVLSSLVRLRNHQRAVEVASTVSRNAVPGVSSYTTKDLIHGLEAVSILNCCHETYAAAVLDRCSELCPTLGPRALGDVCKYVGLLSPGRQSNEVGRACARELRRVLPAVEARAEALLGKFSLRDARYVLRCFTEHKVRHSILFSRLTPFANDA